MIKKLFTLLLLAVIFLSTGTLSSTLATNPSCPHGNGCTSVGQCVNGQECICVNYQYYSILEPSGPACGGGVGSAVIGEVTPPASVDAFNQVASGSSIEGIGIIVFANVLIRLLTIIAGIIVMFNFIRAGWMFLVAGDNTKATGEVKDLLTYSIIGLVIIAVTYTIAGLIGLIFFNDPRFILNPELYSAV